MKSYFIPHKLKVGDITHLSDEDSEIIISKNLHKIEDPIEIYNLDSIFLGLVTDITKASVEVEISKKIQSIETSKQPYQIVLIQSLLNDTRFAFVLEKAVEIGIHRIIPVESTYSTQSRNRCIKKYGQWKKILKEAQEQSRNPYEIEIDKPVKIKNLENLNTKYKICLSTESTTSKKLTDTLKTKKSDASYAIAIGPEKGWSSSDLEVFEKLNFEFTRIGKNILRAETGGLVIASILNFRASKY